MPGSLGLDSLLYVTAATGIMPKIKSAIVMVSNTRCDKYTDEAEREIREWGINVISDKLKLTLYFNRKNFQSNMFKKVTTTDNKEKSFSDLKIRCVHKSHTLF